MKVSIITATYNSAKTIGLTLDSVVGQTYKEIEHIVIDGNSSDDTIEVVRSYPHVAQVLSEPDKGIYDAMNKGLALATGDIIAILNSDDLFFDNNVVQKIVDRFQRDQCQVLYGNTIAGDMDALGNFTRVTRLVRPKAFKRRKFLFGWMPSHVSTYIHKDVYRKYGDFVDTFKIGADYELMLRFMFRHEVQSSYINEFCVKFRVGGISTSTFKNKLVALSEAKQAWEMNNIKPYFFTVIFKPIRALSNIMIQKILPKS